MTVEYRFLIDWDNDGIADANEIARWLAMSPPEARQNVSLRVRHDPPVIVATGRDRARVLSPPGAGFCEFNLENADGLFSSANTASDLYGYLKPGRLTAIRAYSGGTEYPLATMYLDLPAELPARLKREVREVALDGMAKLKATKIATAMYTNITTDVAIGHCLDAAGWPASLRTLATGKTTLARWWVDGVDAFSAIRDLMSSEGPGALVYIDGSGKFVFEDRHYRLLTTRCVTSQATFASSGSEPLFRDFEYDPGLRDIVNVCIIPVKAFTVAGSNSTIWTGPTPITFVSGETKTYTMTTTVDGFTGLVTPVAATDYTLTGTALASVTLSRTSGRSAILTMIAGAGSATVTGLVVRGKTVTIATTFVTNSLDTTTSQDDYGVRALPTDYTPSWVPDANTALDFTNAIVSRYKDPVPTARIVITNSNDTRMAQILSRTVSDRITIQEPLRAFVDADFTVEAKRHRIADGGATHEVLLSCEEADGQAFWVLGESELGTTTRLGY